MGTELEIIWYISHLEDSLCHKSSIFKPMSLLIYAHIEFMIYQSLSG